MMQPNEKPEVRPFAHVPNGLVVTPWGDGVMLSVVDQITRQATACYIGLEGLTRLLSWLIASGIMQGEIHEQTPADVMVQWPGPKSNAS